MLRSTAVFLLLLFMCNEAGGESDKLKELISRFWDWRLEESPAYATEFGLHSFDDQIEEYTEETFERQISNATTFLYEAKEIKEVLLTKQEKISLQLLKYNLQTFIDGFPYRKFGMYNFVTPLERPTDEWASVISMLEFSSVDDYRKLLKRLRLLPVQINQIIDLMRKSIKNGIVAHNVSLTGCLANLEKQIQSNYTLSPMYRPFIYIMVDLNKTEKMKLREEAKEVVTKYVIPTWQRFREFIAQEYSLNTRPNISISSLPGGLEFYKACLRWHLSVDATPEEIHQIGLDEVNRIKNIMITLMRQYNFSGENVREFIAHLNSQPGSFYEKEEDLLQGYREIIDSVHHKLPLILKTIPNISIIVERNTNPQGTAGRYSDPPVDKSKPGIFYANVFNPKERPKYNMVALTLHEAEPGHHTQSSFAAEEDIPMFRRAIELRKYNAIPFNWPFYTAYMEGWSLYAESLGEEMGAYPDLTSLFGRYASEMFRSCRLVVDTGIHAFGWSKEKAAQYLLDHTSQSRESIENEVNRYVSWPGQACSYKIGELKIKQLRARAEKRLGSKFDKREFHDQVLQLGPVPLMILEEYIDSWITETDRGSSSASLPTVHHHHQNLSVVLIVSIVALIRQLALCG